MARHERTNRSASERHRKKGLWTPKRTMAVASIAVVLIAAGAAAAVLIRQQVDVSTSAESPDVTFGQSTGYQDIADAGYGSLDVGESGTSASLSLSGVPGASWVRLSNMMSMANSDAQQAYSVSLSHSGDLNAAITSLSMTIRDGATTVHAWDLTGTNASGPVALPAGTEYTVDFEMTLADGTTPGDLGGFDLFMDYAPA